MSDVFSWFIPWEPSFTALLIACFSAWFYLRGSDLCAESVSTRLRFWLGWLSLYAVAQTSFDYYSEHSFFMHRLQHAVHIEMARPLS